MNDDLATLNPLTRLLFAGLWTIADRDGKLEDRPARIKTETLPYDDCDVDEMLDDLARIGVIERYKVHQGAYLVIPRFDAFQRPHQNEKASEIPDPERDCEEGAPRLSKGDTDVPPRARQVQVLTTSPSTDSVTAVSELWAAYPPVRRNLSDMQLFDRIDVLLGSVDLAVVERMQAALADDLKSRDFIEGFAPKLSDWIDTRRWDRKPAPAGDRGEALKEWAS